MTWILTICTTGWILCGQITRYEYPSKEDCYKERDELYKRHPASDFKYITCRPKEETK